MGCKHFPGETMDLTISDAIPNSLTVGNGRKCLTLDTDSWHVQSPGEPCLAQQDVAIRQRVNNSVLKGHLTVH